MSSSGKSLDALIKRETVLFLASFISCRRRYRIQNIGKIS
jgi:hypothetical protein